jgi:glycosyltransferase involved in cell wall biosynthesis
MAPHRPRVLVVAYHFPPDANIGTMRTLRVVQHLSDCGCDVTVLTSHPGTYRPGTATDDDLLGRVPLPVRVLRARSRRGFETLKRLARRPGAATTGTSAGQRPAGRLAAPRRSPILRSVDVIDAALAIPDQESAWLMPAVVRGAALCARWRPEVLYSSAPPWTTQVVALVLAKATGIPWVADFRDPWARAPWRETQPARIRRVLATLERWVMRRADSILFATRSNREEYASHCGPELARKFHVVPNGCDLDEFAPATSTPNSDVFVMVHAGSLYGARSPVPVFRAIAAAIQRGTVVRERFRLRLIGQTSESEDLASIAGEMGLDDVVEFVSRMIRRDIRAEMTSASALLLLQPGTTVSIPGKLYEYLAIGRPILALCEEGELSDLVRQSGIGVVAAPNDERAIEAGLARVIELASAALPPPPTQLYDGNRTAAEAAAIIRELAGTGRVRPNRSGRNDVRGGVCGS